jgi:lysophospholipase L1-like esterase
MLKQSQRPSVSPISPSPTLKKWVIQGLEKAVGEKENIKIRIRLRGNHLHLLCETPQETEPKQILGHLITGIKKNFKLDPQHFSFFAEESTQPIYQIIVYGKVLGRKKHDWVKTIHLHPHDNSIKEDSPNSKIESSVDEETGGALISYKTLAKSGSTEAIARYLSHQFSALGVSIRVKREKLPLKKQLENAQYRLKVLCECNYSPEPTLLAEPITQELRKLELHGFGEGIIYGQVMGEAEPDWLLRIDLTHPDLMLKEWANWGDPEAIFRLLNYKLNPQNISIIGELKQKTLHLFCSHTSQESPEEKNTVTEITNYLDSLSPQGVEALTIYGVRPIKNKQSFAPPDLQKEKPVWIAWHKLPASYSEELKKTPLELAQEDNFDALNFLINRALNPNLDARLNTGGIRARLRQKQDLLHILAEGVVCPAQTQVMFPLEKLFRNLTITGIRGIRIYGRRSGQVNSLWHEKIDFIKRKSSHHELLSEFTTLNYLEIDPAFLKDDLPIIGDSTENVTAPSKPNFLENLSHRLQWLLGKSGLFIVNRQEDNNFVTNSLHLSTNELTAYKGLKVAMVWSVVGLLLTLQIDWIFGRLGAMETGQNKSNVVVSKASAEEETQVITLPEISLQKSEWENVDPSENQSFTEMGSTEIISEVEARDNQRKQPSVADILATYKENNPKFNNPFLEEKLALYNHRVEKEGAADIIIIGSSRAMRGIDPYGLQMALKEQGYPELNIFNFGINGATVKIVDLVLRQLVNPEDLPKMVIFADGARAFNSGRSDITYQMIENSEGYNQVLAGMFPPPKENSDNSSGNLNLIKPSFSQQYQGVDQWLNESVAQFSSAYGEKDQLKGKVKKQFVNLFQWVNLPDPENRKGIKRDENTINITPNGIDYDGFFPLSIQFNPQTYYESHPHVAGAYDGDYQGFNLEGEQHQSLLNLIKYLQENNVQFVFVNQPLTDNYLDPVRLKYEQEFNKYMTNLSVNYAIIFRDFVNRKSWQKEYNFFSDPSHLNRYGAYQLAEELAVDSMINWGSLMGDQ